MIDFKKNSRIKISDEDQSFNSLSFSKLNTEGNKIDI